LLTLHHWEFKSGMKLQVPTSTGISHGRTNRASVATAEFSRKDDFFSRPFMANGHKES